MVLYSTLLGGKATKGTWGANASPNGYSIFKINTKGIWGVECRKVDRETGKTKRLFFFTDGSMHTFIVYALLHFKEEYPDLCYILECNDNFWGARLARELGTNIFGEKPAIEVEWYKQRRRKPDWIYID